MTVFQSSLVLNLDSLLIFSVRDEFVGGEAIGKRDFMLLRVDYISGGLYQLKMCKRAGTVHISCSGSYLIVPFIHVFRVPFV